MKPIDRYRQVQAMREDAQFQSDMNSPDAGVFFLKVLLAVVLWVIVLAMFGLLP